MAEIEVEPVIDFAVDLEVGRDGSLAYMMLGLGGVVPRQRGLGQPGVSGVG